MSDQKNAANHFVGKENLDPSDPYKREQQTFPQLTPDQIERLKPFGTTEKLTKGTVVFERGDRTVDFFVVLSGSIEIYEHRHTGKYVFTTHRTHQFTGELDLFNDRQILVGGRMGEDGEVLRIKRADFRKMLSAEPALSEIIIRAFILRRVGLISHKQGSVTLICPQSSADTIRIERFLRRNGYPLHLLNDPTEQEHQNLVERYNLEPSDFPAVLIHLGERIVKNPSNFELAECLGLTEEPDYEKVYDAIIVGAGPAGLSAATYAASEGLSVLLIEQEAPGGQASTSSKIENYLGFPTGISGQALAGRAQVQAQKFGTKIVLPRQASGLKCHKDCYKIALCNGQQVSTKTIVIATGAKYRTLNIENARKFDNAGVYYAATAMEARLCSDKEIIVVGGGNSAGQAAVFLSNHAKHVHLLIRGESLAASMSDYLIERISSSSAITLHRHTEITDLLGNAHLEGVTWKNNQSLEEQTHPIRHVFLMIGAMPNTDWLDGHVMRDEKKFIITGPAASQGPDWPKDRPAHMLETSMPGIYAAGDVRSGSIKRVASGVGEGSMTVSHIHQFLSEL